MYRLKMVVYVFTFCMWHSLWSADIKRTESDDTHLPADVARLSFSDTSNLPATPPMSIKGQGQKSMTQSCSDFSGRGFLEKRLAEKREKKLQASKNNKLSDVEKKGDDTIFEMD